MTVVQLVGELEKVKGQISQICSNLFDAGKIRRANRYEPWSFVIADKEKQACSEPFQVVCKYLRELVKLKLINLSSAQ